MTPDEAHYAWLNSQPRLDRGSLASWRAAWWAFRTVRRTRRALKETGLATRVAPPPELPWGARVGVNAVLDRFSPTCLERALVLQAWLAAHDVPRDVVVGVAGKEDKVKAHAWVDGIAPAEENRAYTAIYRIRPVA
jgi:Transglutaminase-like superfamily